MIYMKPIRPSEVYGSKDLAQGAIGNRKILAFRIPNIGDYYLTGGYSINRASTSADTAGAPRFIVEENTPPTAFNQVWE